MSCWGGGTNMMRIRAQPQSGRQASLPLNHPSQGSPWQGPFRHPRSVVVIAPAPKVIRLKNLLLATLLIAACYADLKPVVRI
jgi:hypothetical protein